MSSFINYSRVLLDGLTTNAKSDEVIAKKYDLLNKILESYNIGTTNILFVGFSPWCLSDLVQDCTITEVDATVIDYLKLNSSGCSYSHLDDLIKSDKKFDAVVAVEEYFTFANTDDDQRNLVKVLAGLTDKVLITTLRDYKNQDYKEREFSQPILIRGSGSDKIYLEHFDYDIRDKNASVSRAFVIHGDSTTVHGPFTRRNMYFKQLAKFSIDFGAKNFYVHKNLMYKSVIKKNYEHVITIEF